MPRPRLVGRLTAALDIPLVLVIAPAGYGKTTLLSEWAAHDPRPFTWLAADDSAALPGSIAAAIADAHREGDGAVLVVDDAPVLPTADAARVGATVAQELPPGCTLAIAARRPPRLPLGRLRAHGIAVEVGPEDLALSRLEAALLCHAAGLRLDAAEVDRLVARTGGWPALLALAVRVVRAEVDPHDAVERFAGDDRVIADYLRSEVVEGLPAETRAFLRTTSVLEPLTAAACDAVRDAAGSASILDELVDAGVPVELLDRRSEAVRLNPALADMLRTELARFEPERARRLHRRAADWHHRQGATALAVEHALIAADRPLAARLLWSLAPRLAARGRTAELGRFVDRLRQRELAQTPELALATAIFHLGDARRDHAELLLDAVPAPPGDRRDLASGATLLRACIARDGLRAMGEDAALASRLLPPGSPWRALADLLEGVGLHLAGEREEAEGRLERGARHGQHAIPVVAALCHAQLALLAADGADWDEAALRVSNAAAALEPVDAATPLIGLVQAVAAAVAAERGDVAAARRAATQADATVVRLAGFTPWYLAESQIWLARAEIRLSDAPAARRLLTAAARAQALVPDAPLLARWLHEAWERTDAFAAGALGDGPALTRAELRVLRFMPSHLSFREVGIRLHVSTNTVKTQALSVYRKLDVGCRSDAVTRGRAIGLITG